MIGNSHSALFRRSDSIICFSSSPAEALAKAGYVLRCVFLNVLPAGRQAFHRRPLTVLLKALAGHPHKPYRVTILFAVQDFRGIVVIQFLQLFFGNVESV